MANEYLNNKTFETIIQEFQYFKRQKARCELILLDQRETYERRLSKYGHTDKNNLFKANELDYIETCKHFENYQNQLAFAFYILSENIANYAKFSGIDLDDAIQEGVLICFEKIDRFNPNYKGKSGQKAKAFNYMTTCILNHMRQLYRSARNYSELKKKYLVFLQNKFENIMIRNGKERYSHKNSE